MKIRASRSDVAVRLTVRGGFIFVGKEVVEVEDSDEVREQIERFVRRGYLEIIDEKMQGDARIVQEDAGVVQEDVSNMQDDVGAVQEVRRRRRSRR